MNDYLLWFMLTVRVDSYMYVCGGEAPHTQWISRYMLRPYQSWCLYTRKLTRIPTYICTVSNIFFSMKENVVSFSSILSFFTNYFAKVNNMDFSNQNNASVQNLKEPIRAGLRKFVRKLIKSLKNPFHFTWASTSDESPSFKFFSQPVFLGSENTFLFCHSYKMNCSHFRI